MCPQQGNIVIVIDKTTHLQERTTRCLEMRHLVMSTFDFKIALHITSEESQEAQESLRFQNQRQKN